MEGYKGERELTEDEHAQLECIPMIPDEELHGADALTEHITDETELVDNDVCKVTYLWKDQHHLVFHAWRGKEIEELYWGEGHFGIAFTKALKEVFPVDDPSIEYISEVDSYFAIIPNMGLKPKRPDEARIAGVAEVLTGILREEIAG